MTAHQVVFQSPRTFRMFSYSASHGLLLLRSGKKADADKRINLLFKDVRVMEIRCWFEGIEISIADASYLDSFPSRPKALMEHGNVVYSLLGADWRGFILGGIYCIEEDDGGFFAPSALLGANTLQV